jgi:hypothetical protein
LEGNKLLTGQKMNVRKKPMETMRFSKERTTKLKEKSIEITLKIKDIVEEQELVNYLLDHFLERIDVTKDGKLFIRDEDE